MQEFLDRIGATDYIENYDEDALFDIFLDEDLSFEFITIFREFSRLLDALYPSPDALDFVKDFKTYRLSTASLKSTLEIGDAARFR